MTDKPLEASAVNDVITANAQAADAANVHAGDISASNEISKPGDTSSRLLADLQVEHNKLVARFEKFLAENFRTAGY